MKVILINPPFNIPKANYDSSISVGLLCLVSYLDSKGMEVKLIDGARQENWEEVLRREVAQDKDKLGLGYPKPSLSLSLCVGLSVMTTQVAKALEISKMVKEINPGAKVVWGGVHATLFPKQTLEHELVDYIVVNEGEETLHELVKFLGRVQKRLEVFRYGPVAKFGCEEDIVEMKGIRGLGFKVGGEMIINEVRDFLDMDKLPQINWDLVDKGVLEKLELVPTHTSRGCPHRCAFCINTVTCNKWRGRSADRVLEDIKLIVSKEYFHGKPLRLWDEDFFAVKPRAWEIVKGIIQINKELPEEKKLKWDVGTTGLPVHGSSANNKCHSTSLASDVLWETTVRADYFRESMISDEFLQDLKDSGCYLLSFGAESGSQRILDKITKDVSVEQIIYSARECLKYGVTPQYSFMVGIPGEEIEDMRLSMKLIDQLLALSPKVQVLGPQAFRPYPGSQLYNECIAAGWQEPKSLEEWAEAARDELNFLDPQNFPWLKNENKDLVDSLEAYVRFGAHTLRSAMGSTVKSGKLVKLIFILICKLRWQLKWFKWPVEYRAAKRFVSMG